MAKFNVEYTDTFGGEANYCWVRREVIECDIPVDKNGARERALKRQAKAAVGLTGVDGRWSDYGGDMLKFRPYRMCTVLFVSWADV